MAQIVFLLLSYFGLKKIKAENLNMYSKGDFFVSFYNLILILSFIAYIIYCTSINRNTINILGVFSAIVLIVTIIKAVFARDVRLVYFSFMIALLPSIFISSLSAFLNGIPSENRFEYIIVWSLSNYILLQTAGYLMYQIFFTREIKMLENNKILKIDASSIAFYISILIWNLLILWMMNNDIIKVNSSIYFFHGHWGTFFLS
ncbi:hypothetical protein [Xylanibacter caecicola]|uniref:hypothetical protein n=1 Tax=Xylanibacter caecicola TaxID=2736294 RepID=UPI00258D7B8D|nr:hypothetical protein [Xylanibacter caecicola]